MATFIINARGEKVPYNEPTQATEQTGIAEETLKAPKRIVGGLTEELGMASQYIARGLNRLYQGRQEIEAPPGTGLAELGRRWKQEAEIAPSFRQAHPNISKAGDIAEGIAQVAIPLAVEGIASTFAPQLGVPAAAGTVARGFRAAGKLAQGGAISQFALPATFGAAQGERSYESAKATGMSEEEALKASVLPAVAAGGGMALMPAVSRFGRSMVATPTTVEGIVAPAVSDTMKRFATGTAFDTMLNQVQSAAVVGAEAYTGARPEADMVKEVWRNPDAWLASLGTAGIFTGYEGARRALQLRNLKDALGNAKLPTDQRMLAAEQVQNSLRESNPKMAEEFGAVALDAIQNKKAIPIDFTKQKDQLLQALRDKVADPNVDLDSRVEDTLATPITVAEKPKTINENLHDALTFSVSKGVDPNADMTNTKLTEDYLQQNGIQYKRVQGMYAGSPEESFILANTPENAKLVQRMANKFEQESILHTDAEGNSKLVFNDGREEAIGKLREVTPEETKGLMAFTFDPETGKYYSTLEAQDATQIRTGEQGTEFQGASEGYEGERPYREQPQTEIQRSSAEADNRNRPVERTGEEVKVAEKVSGLDAEDIVTFDAKDKAQVERDLAMTRELNPQRAEQIQQYYDQRFGDPLPKTEVVAPTEIKNVKEKVVLAPVEKGTPAEPGEIFPVKNSPYMAVRAMEDGTMSFFSRKDGSELARAEIFPDGTLNVEYGDELNVSNRDTARARIEIKNMFESLRKEKKFAVELNASGESAASLEAIRRNGNEPPRLRFDTRTGKGNILRGVDSVDYQPGAFEVIIQRSGRDGEMTIVSQGSKVTDSLLSRTMSKYRAAVEDGMGVQDSSPEAGIALSNPSKKVIGLDIDGVFNTGNGTIVDSSRVIEFNKILNKNGNPDVVLGSTWRESALIKNDIAEAQAVIDELGIKARVVGVTPDLGGDANIVSRGSEYKAWENTYGRKYGTDLVAVLDDRADLTELGARHIKTVNGLDELSLNQLDKTINPTPTLTKDIIQKAYPKSKIEETPEGFKLKTPGGVDMLFKEQSVILMTPRERILAEQAYGRELRPEEQPVAVAELGLETIMSFTPRGVKNIDHEKWHWAEYAVLTPKEIEIVSKKYATEEARADAYQEYIGRLAKNPAAKPANMLETVWQKIVDFFERLKSVFTKTPENVFKELASGRAETREPFYEKYSKETLEIFASLGKTPKTAIEAWHGSAADFEAFNREFMGTGEGAQAFGFGHYVTEKRGIAEGYRKKLSTPIYDLIVDGKRVPSSDVTYGTQLIAAKGGYVEAKNAAEKSVLSAEIALVHSKEALDTYEKGLEKLQDPNPNVQVKDQEESRDGMLFQIRLAKQRLLNAENNVAMMKGMLRDVEGLKDAKVEPIKPGHTYQVEIIPDQKDMLHWNKPLSEQSDKVNSALYKAALQNPEGALNRAMGEKDNGKWVYTLLKDELGSPEAASNYLHSLGIKGIQYLAEGGTGGKGQDVHNYVVFDDADLKIIKKYAIQDIARPIMESKFVEDDVKPKIVNTVKNLKETQDQALRAIAPAARSEAAFQTQAEFRQVLGEMWNKQLQAATKVDKIMKDIRGEVSTVSSVLDAMRSQGKTLADNYFARMPEGEQHDFMARMDAGRDQIDAPRQAIANFMKEMFDARVQAIQELGTGLLTNIQTGDGENPYFPRYWERGEEAERAIYNSIAKRPLDTRKSFAAKRVFGDIYEGINAGYKLMSNNPMDLFFMKVGEMDRYIAAHKMLQSLEGEGLARLVPAGEGMDPGEINILGTYGTVKRAEVDANGVQLLDSWKTYKYAVQEDVAQVINNYLSQNLYNNKYIGKAFSGYMNLANNLNQMQLGVGSMFHGGFTSLEAIISHAALGIKAIFNGEVGKGIKYLAEAPAEVIRNPKVGNAVLAEMAAPGSQGVNFGMNIPLIAENAILAGARKGMDTRFQTHTTEKMFEAWASGNKIGASIRAPFAMIEQMARPLMEWLVPRQKFGVFADMSSYWMNEHPNASFTERREAMQEIWNRVDSRLGQVVYDRLFVNNIAKNFVQGALRAPGWTGGTLLEIGGGIKDVGDLIRNVAQGKKPNMSDRTAYTVSLILTTMVANGILTSLLTGETPEGRDFIAFRTGNRDEHGFDERFMLPTYMKDILAYSESPGTTLLHKLHPALGVARDIIQNKDYYGTEVRHEGDNVVAQAAQLAGFAAQQYVPFWWRGLQKEAERDGSVMAMGAPLIGIMPAPSDLNRTAAEKMIRKFVVARMPATTKTKTEFERSKTLTKLTTEFRLNNPDAEKHLQEALDKGIISLMAAKQIKRQAKLSPIEAGYKRLSIEEARKVMEKATPTERALLEKILKNKEARFKKLYPNAEENSD